MYNDEWDVTKDRDVSEVFTNRVSGPRREVVGRTTVTVHSG